MKISIDGLDDAIQKLEGLEKAIEDLEGERTLSMHDVISDQFIADHSEFSNLEPFLSASGFDTSSQESFEAIPDDDWDAYVQSATDFSNWDEMLEAAATDWVSSQLGLD